MASDQFYRRADMASLAANAAALGIMHDMSRASTEVALPPLVFGAPFLDRWPIHEQPGGASWRDPAYTSCSPWAFTLPDALVHSAAGIVCVGESVVEETLVHADPERDGFAVEADGIRLDPSGATALPGLHVSLLTGGSSRSYFHALIDGLGRLSVTPEPLLAEAAGVLVPDERPSPATWLRDRACERWGLRRIAVPDQASLRVERLVLAKPCDASCNYHPSLGEWFDTRAALADRGRATPPHIYIDRRGTALRRLRNEGELVAALEAIGIVPVALEAMSPIEQIALFRNASLVVGPHGAGFANLVFARPGCHVIELQMDAYCNWCFRRMAAVKSLPYDCLLGRADAPLQSGPGAIHGASWAVSVPHVVAAVQASLPG